MSLSNLTWGGWIAMAFVLTAVIDALQDIAIPPDERIPFWRKGADLPIAKDYWNPISLSFGICYVLWLMTP